MVKFFKMPAVKIGSVFLAGMLVVVLMSLASGLHGLPSVTWADENSAAVMQSTQLPGLGPDTIPNMVSMAPAVVRSILRSRNSADPFFNDPSSGSFSASSASVTAAYQGCSLFSTDGYILTNEHVIGRQPSEVNLSNTISHTGQAGGGRQTLTWLCLKQGADSELPL